MTTTQAPAAPSALRREIENALAGGIAGTVRWIASKVNRPLRAVTAELQYLELEGKLTTRTTRANEVLYKLPDVNHHNWAALRGSPFAVHRHR